ILKVLADTDDLPAAPTLPRADQQTAKRSFFQGEAGVGGRILLAEDNEINQELVAEILREAGFDCHIVPDGQQAVQALLQRDYDLVLMDCHMPAMDGFQATQVIREKEQAGLLAGRKTSIPIIALTANAMK